MRISRSHHNLEFRVYSLPEFIRSGRSGPCGADIVLLQTWYEFADDEKSVIFGKLADYHPGAKLIYLDWFSPLDLRLAEVVE